ncbi:DUF3667 domain-containing protein [Arenimonas fontis]|uniref:DUF3667 domain-containing protein n=1 Tax=Arenimonas fontis TaxID=2608255 RepID=A0A5B2ZBS9_9GAMM|nr:DUF3667 domain-containing protein [Arenimonas fontis]KAA2284644.1 DUF3667 domain-containing protein [Arenimonas fontis]
MSDESIGSAAAAPTPERRCQNCDAVLLGEHCYACGQPTKGLVRHFSSIVGDFFDSVFELDSRILRTLGPLLFRPGFLSEEYFAGRRVRYVSPVRLFVFLSLFAFIAAQWSFDLSGEDQVVRMDADTPARAGAPLGRDLIRQATTPEEVRAARDQVLAELRRTRAETVDVPGLSLGLEAAEQAIAAAAQERITELEAARRDPAGAVAGATTEPAADDSQAADQVPATPPPLPADAREEKDTPRIYFNSQPWDPVSNPVRIGWLPEGGNRRINAYVGRAQGNIARIQEDPNLLKDAFLSAVPTTLFIMLPLFAVLLKIVYLFKRRLYMEHLIVALHSHSFLCAALLLVLLLDALAGWSSGLPWLSRPLGWLETLLIVWMPLYLLLMQKRVYRQGWIMTLFKYSVLGTCYLILVSFGATFALLLSLVQM